MKNLIRIPKRSSVIKNRKQFYWSTDKWDNLDEFHNYHIQLECMNWKKQQHRIFLIGMTSDSEE